MEFGDPWDLISKKDGTFRSMCETSGEIEALESEAKKAYDVRKQTIEG